jgi:hypothetical protein
LRWWHQPPGNGLQAASIQPYPAGENRALIWIKSAQKHLKPVKLRFIPCSFALGEIQESEEARQKVGGLLQLGRLAIR